MQAKRKARLVGRASFLAFFPPLRGNLVNQDCLNL
jgi:hypothetical protein